MWRIGLADLEQNEMLLVRLLRRFPHLWSKMTTFEHMLDSVRKGRWLLWGVWDEENVLRMLVISRFDGPPEQLAFVICWAAGPEGALEVALHMELFEDLARSYGCKDIQVAGRKGWGRSLRQAGYEDRYYVIGKAL